MEHEDKGQGANIRGGIPPEQAGGGRRGDPTEDAPPQGGAPERNPEAADEASQDNAQTLGSVGPGTQSRPPAPGEGTGGDTATRRGTGGESR